MKNKQINNPTKPNLTPIIKIGKPLKEIIPSIYNNYRIMNTLHNYENFVVKKLRDYTPPYEPYQIFPEWPLEDEIKVYF